MTPIYNEYDYVPGGVEVYRVKYKDGATYEYRPGRARLVENVSPEVRYAQRNASRTTPAKPTWGIEWFEGAGSLMFFVLFILPMLLCILVYGVYPVLLIIGVAK